MALDHKRILCKLELFSCLLEEAKMSLTASNRDLSERAHNAFSLLSEAQDILFDLMEDED